MNQPQIDAIEKATQLLSEHFEVYLLSVGYEDERGRTQCELFWDGSYLASLGLAHRTLDKVCELGHEQEDEDEGA